MNSIKKLNDEELVTYYQLYKDTLNNSKRAESVKIYGYDLKFAYHVVRLLNEIEQILLEGDIDLERNREQLKSIRRGEWTKEQVVKYFETKEKDLESLYTSSNLQHSPNEKELKKLLLECLEMYFGNLESAVIKDISVESIVNDLEGFVQKIRTKYC